MANAVLAGIKLVVFDVDGVIFDIVEAIRDTVVEGLEKYHLKADLQDAMQDISGVMELAQSMPIPQIILNAKELLEVPLLEGFTILKKLRIAVSFYSKYRERKDKIHLFPGIEATIKGLVQQGYKLAILSNNKRSYVVDALQKEGLDTYFENIIGFNEVTKTKPDPEGLLKILELEGVSAEETLFIGDMITDIQTGNNAQVKTIAVASGLCEKSKLEAQNPYQLVNNILELQVLFRMLKSFLLVRIIEGYDSRIYLLHPLEKNPFEIFGKGIMPKFMD